MPPKLDPNGDSELIAVRLTPELTAALDAEVMRQRAENPDVYIGRSNVLRALVRKALLATAPPRPATAPSAAVVEAPVEAPVERKPRKPRTRPDVPGGVREHVTALRVTLGVVQIAARASVSPDTVQKALRGGTISPASAAALLAVSVEEKVS